METNKPLLKVGKLNQGQIIRLEQTEGVITLHKVIKVVQQNPHYYRLVLENMTTGEQHQRVVGMTKTYEVEVN